MAAGESLAAEQQLLGLLLQVAAAKLLVVPGPFWGQFCCHCLRNVSSTGSQPGADLICSPPSAKAFIWWTEEAAAAASLGCWAEQCCDVHAAGCSAPLGATFLHSKRVLTLL